MFDKYNLFMRYYQSYRKCFKMQFYTKEHLMSAQRKNITTQKVSLQLKGQEYPIIPSNIYFLV